MNQSNHKTLTPFHLFGWSSIIAARPRFLSSSPSTPSLSRALAIPTVATASPLPVLAFISTHSKRTSGGTPRGSPNSSPSSRSRGFLTPCSIQTSCPSTTTSNSRCDRCFLKRNWTQRRWAFTSSRNCPRALCWMLLLESSAVFLSVCRGMNDL